MVVSKTNGRKPERLTRLKEGGEFVYSTLFLHSPSAGVRLLVGYLPDDVVAEIIETYVTNAVHVLETQQRNDGEGAELDEPGDDLNNGS